MSDFIGHLLAQVRPAGTPGLEPRSPSRFEGAAGSDAWGIETVHEADSAPAAAAHEAAPLPSRAAETSTPPPAAPPVPSRSRRRLPEAVEAPSPVAPRSEAAAEPFRAILPEPSEHAPDRIVMERILSETREILPIPMPAPVAGEAATSPAVAADALAPVAMPVAPADQPSRDPEAASDEAGLSPVEPRSAPEPVAPLIPPPPVAAAPLEPQIMPEIAAPQPEPMPAPIVEVRIGRIEIHAPETAAPLMAAPVPAAASGGSRLDLYLARR